MTNYAINRLIIRRSHFFKVTIYTTDGFFGPFSYIYGVIYFAMKRSFFLFLIALLCLGCNSDHELDLAESLIHTHPDSSLVILKGWKPRHPDLSKSEQARYSLLMSMALDKNYIDVASDSIILPAVRYYASHPGKERMLAYYYQGLVYKNMGSTSASIVALEKSEADAKDMHDYYNLGLIYRNKVGLFTESGDIPAAIQCARASVQNFSLAEADLYEQYARLTLAISLINNKEYDLALSELDSLSHEAHDKHLISRLTLHRAQCLWAKNAPPDSIIHLYRQIPKSYFDALDYGRLAESFEKMGQKDSADYWLNVGFALAPNQNYKATLDYRKARLEKSRGNYRAAFELLDRVSAYQDSLTRVRLAESISAAQRDYFKQERNLQTAKANTATTRLYLWIALSIFVFVLIILLFVLQMNKKEARLRDGLATLHSIESTVTKLSSDNALLVGGLVNERLKDLEAFSNKYCLADSDTEKEAIAKQYKKALEAFRNNPALFAEIEELLNRYCDNLMIKFKEQFPAIKGDKLKMATLFFTRLPYKKIELFFKHYTADSLKKAKNRLRGAIQGASVPDKALFLDSLEMKKGGRRSKQCDV